MNDHTMFEERPSIEGTPKNSVDYRERLNQHLFYETMDAVFAGHIVSDSTIAAEAITDSLLTKVFEVLYDKYLESKQRPHEIGLTMDLIERVSLVEFAGYDGIENVFPEDTEAVAPTFDNYCRARIPTKKDHQPLVEASFSKIYNELSPGLHTSIFRFTEDLGRERAKKHLVEISKEQVPEPIDLRDKGEDTTLEDQLREAKERTKQRLMQEESQRKLMEEAAHLERMKLAKLNAEITKKSYTFDYDGKVIMMNKAKTDKLLTVSYPINFAINSQTAEDQLNNKKVNTNMNLSTNSAKDLSRILKQKRAPIAEREFTKMIVGPPQIFEEIKPKMGVKIIEGGRKKEGPLFTLTSPTQASATLLSTTSASSHRLGNGEKMRKDEYIKMIQGGNLSRQGLNGPLIEEDKVVSEMRSNDSLDYSKLSLFKGPVPPEKGKPKVSKLFSPRELSVSSVQVHSSRLAEIMSSKDDLDSEFSGPGTGKGPYQGHAIKIDDTLQTNKIDSFNMGILASKDWGRNISVGMASNAPTNLPKGALRSLELTLGMKPKYPRDRLTRIVPNSTKVFTRDTYAPFSP